MPAGIRWLEQITGGAGFVIACASQVFGVFHHLHGPGFPGPGIGLAIGPRIAGRHGGRVWAEGHVGGAPVVVLTSPAGERACTWVVLNRVRQLGWVPETAGGQRAPGLRRPSGAMKVA